MEAGVGTSHPMTTLRALGPEPMVFAYEQPSHRPTDGRYDENPNRLQHYYLFQVVLKPSLDNIQELYLDSLNMLGFAPTQDDIRFVILRIRTLTKGVAETYYASSEVLGFPGCKK